jgi:hypothetical protein
MRQLVGCSCVRCHQTIRSIAEARFCSDCGNPVHHDCTTHIPEAPDKCPTCGGDVASGLAAEVRRERQATTQTAAVAAGERYPVSRVCPKCGGTTFRRVRPASMVAFALDRVCEACGTRYTPTTPLWAAIAMILTGLVLMLMGFGGGFFSMAAADICALLCEGSLAVLGVLAIVQGARSLFR